MQKQHIVYVHTLHMTKYQYCMYGTIIMTKTLAQSSTECQTHWKYHKNTRTKWNVTSMVNK